MPTVLYIFGWRLFFYSNEGTETVHIHAEKGDMECKYWLLTEEVEIKRSVCIQHDAGINERNKKNYIPAFRPYC